VKTFSLRVWLRMSSAFETGLTDKGLTVLKPPVELTPISFVMSWHRRNDLTRRRYGSAVVLQDFVNLPSVVRSKRAHRDIRAHGPGRSCAIDNHDLTPRALAVAGQAKRRCGWCSSSAHRRKPVTRRP